MNLEKLSLRARLGENRFGPPARNRNGLGLRPKNGFWPHHDKRRKMAQKSEEWPENPFAGNFSGIFRFLGHFAPLVVVRPQSLLLTIFSYFGPEAQADFLPGRHVHKIIWYLFYLCVCCVTLPAKDPCPCRTILITETKRNKKKQKETKRNKKKQKETKRNKKKQKETKRKQKETKRNKKKQKQTNQKQIKNKQKQTKTNKNKQIKTNQNKSKQIKTNQKQTKTNQN